MSRLMKQHHVVIATFNACQILDVTGPMQVFASLNEYIGQEKYRITIACADGVSATATCGLQMVTTPFQTIPAHSVDTFIVAGGKGTLKATENHDFIAWVQECAKHAERVCSVCTGTFFLAAAGLTAGKRVSTHWNYVDTLQSMHPDTKVEADAIYTKDGTLWSSAGVTAGIDMALAIVETDYGRKAALTIAKHLVVYAHRPGNQSQFSTLLEGQSKTSGGFSELINWMAENIERAITVETMAEKAGMTQRSFHRRFTREIGATPAKYLERLRLDTARALLERTKEPLKAIAAKSGFGAPVRLIHVFERRMGMSPSAYRHLHGRFS